VLSPKGPPGLLSHGQEVQVGLTQLDEDLVDMVKRLPSVVSLTANQDDNLLSVTLGSEMDTPSLVRALVEYGVGVRYVKPLETSLEEAYLELMEEEQ
jgi:hypothetical protein